MLKKGIFCLILCLYSLASVAQLNTDRILSIGRNALYFEDYVLSIQYFNQIIRSKPFLEEPYFYRAVAKIQLEDYIGAEKDLDVVIQRNPFIPMAFYARGFCYKMQGKWQLASDDFTKALEFSPENSSFIINRVQALSQLKEYDKALFDINALLKKEPNSIELQREKGYIYLFKQDTINAASQFNLLVQLDAYNARSWSNRAYIYLLQNKQDSALHDYNKAIQLGSQFSGDYINRGIINYRVKNYRTALSDYDKAIELDPDNISALFNRSLLRCEVGDLNNAVLDLKSVLKLQPSNYEALLQLAQVESTLGDHRDAIKNYTKILHKYPEFIPALYARSNAYRSLGKEKLAFLDQEKAYTIKQNHKTKKKQEKKEEKPDTSEKIEHTINSQIKDLTGAFALNNTKENEHSTIRGAIQNTKVAFKRERNFVLSYYNQKKAATLSSTHHNNWLNQFNANYKFHGPLYMVNNEVPLSGSMINFHFNSIKEISQQLIETPNQTSLLLERAFDYALVQDFNNSIADFSKAIFYGEKSLDLAYFSRANIRYKQLEFEINNQQNTMNQEGINSVKAKGLDLTHSSIAEKRYAITFELIMRDYDQCLKISPKFAYAWFNRGNMLSIQKDYKAAIKDYSRAINCDSDFGEAYYNRGLTYIFLKENKKGLSDLSKAGELGIYKAYSLLKSLNKYAQSNK